MSVRFEVQSVETKGVLSVAGRIDSSNAKEFEISLFELLDTGPDGGVVVECAGLEYVSSAGLRVLLMGAKRQKRSGRAFAVCNLSENTRKVFTMGGFDKILSIYPTLADTP